MSANKPANEQWLEEALKYVDNLYEGMGYSYVERILRTLAYTVRSLQAELKNKASVEKAMKKQWTAESLWWSENEKLTKIVSTRFGIPIKINTRIHFSDIPDFVQQAYHIKAEALNKEEL
jgi:hypothetical protein